MHVNIRVALLSFFVAIFGLVTPALAVEDSVQETTNDSQSSEQSTETEVKNTAQSTVEEKQKVLEERIAEYKEKQAQKLEAAEAKRVQARCKMAQIKIESLKTRIDAVVENRQNIYNSIDTKLSELLAKLQKAGIDTTTYEAAREDVRVDLQSLQESMQSYSQVLADLIVMDCEADPDAFKAALESARNEQASIRQKSQEFRAFATNQLKSILQDVRKQLEELNQADENSQEVSEEQ